MTKTETFLSALLIALMVSGLAFVCTMPFGKAQSGTNVSYIISTDTTWTQGNSPYNFTGNILIPTGVTLTVGNGATVDLNNYYLEVNGTLIIQPGATINIGLIGDGIDVYGTMSAEGTSANPIQIIGSVQGHIMMAFFSAVTFFPSSVSWDPQTNSGSLIENTDFNQTLLNVQSGIRISNSNFLSGGLMVESASPTIVNNDITTGLTVIQNPNILANANAIQPEISSNTIAGGLSLLAGGGVVNDNTITGGTSGALILSDEYNVPISTLILRNLINDSPVGISCNMQSSYDNEAIIENNTVTNNTVGVQIGSTNVPSIINNNIYGNSYNAKLYGVSQQISLINNWWGTTDVQAINQTIYDFKDDFTLGTVNFVPFLTAPNLEATPNPNAPIPTPAPTPTPTPPTSPFNNQTITHQPTPPFLTRTPPPNSTSSASPNSSTSSSQSYLPKSSLTTELIIAAVAIAFVAATIGAFLLGKKAGGNRHVE